MINYKDYKHYSIYDTLDYNNKIILKGSVENIVAFPKTEVASIFVSTYRLSKNKDTVRVFVPAKQLPSLNLTKGCFVNIDGQIRTINRMINGKSKLVVSVKPNTIEKVDFVEEDKNEGVVIGHLVKKPVLRATPFNRQITDFLIAVQNDDNKHSSYIPGIAWGKNATFISQFDVGDKFAIEGRLQSREYEKVQENGFSKTLTAYEFSANRVSFLRENNSYIK